MMHAAEPNDSVRAASDIPAVPGVSPRQSFDLTLYLVTDSGLLPPGVSLVEQVEQALLGGVTIVQLREKKLNTRAFIDLGRKLHQITKKFGVPLLINDRIDVALAVGCEGVHIGWDDCAYEDARQILGEDKIIGVSVSNITQAEKAAAAGCDYIGVGPIYSTNTKPDHDPLLGTQGLRSLLEHISALPGPSGTWGKDVPVVAIGGINLGNMYYVMYQSVSPAHPERKYIAGVALVSAIIAAREPRVTCERFRKLIAETPPFAKPQIAQFTGESGHGEELRSIFRKVVDQRPMIHHITNNVVKNFSANVTLAIGASPIMSEDISEFAELAKYGGGLVVNMGTTQKASWPVLLGAVQTANAHANPVVFDPVGAGASALRRSTSREVVSTGYCDVIKGNESEIRTVYKENSIQQRGVDSAPSRSTEESELEKARLAKSLAIRERNIVVMTGVVDYISDGVSTFKVEDGHHYQGSVTGTGCSLGSVIAACLAANPERKLSAAVAAVSYYNAAARVAGMSPEVSGPGTWQPVFLDNLYRMRTGFDTVGEGVEPGLWKDISEHIKKVDV